MTDITNKSLIIFAAIGAVTILESIALLTGINGSLLMIALTIVGGLAGYQLKNIKEKMF